jgi:Holliday junction resolvase RusA-like endonuclease
MMEKTFILSVAPPSLNNAFANRPRQEGPVVVSRVGLAARRKGYGRIKNRRYVRWQRDAGWEIKQQRHGFSLQGAFGVQLEVGRGLSRADGDNLIKPVVDLLVALGVVPNDRHMAEVSMRFADRPDLAVRVYTVTP